MTFIKAPSSQDLAASLVSHFRLNAHADLFRRGDEREKGRRGASCDHAVHVASFLGVLCLTPAMKIIRLALTRTNSCHCAPEAKG